LIDSPIKASLLALSETNNVGNRSGILSIDIKPVFPFAFEEIADVKHSVNDIAIDPSPIDTIKGVRVIRFSSDLGNPIQR
jgi:hypothetical protein